MIHVYNNGRSRTARKLQALLDEHAEGAGVVNWTGAPLDSDIDIVLNGASRTNKLAQLARLELKEVNVPPWGFDRLDGSWYPRTLNHQQGFDFTEGPTRADYWVKKLDLAEEW